ncbi:hypothetical protein ACI0YR_003930 [Cronobacter dublinensis]
MSTISNERLEELANGDMEVWYSESQSMARELLALRKERERAVPVGEVVLGEPDDEGNYPNAGVLCLYGCADWDNFPDGYKLYGRPPAQPVAVPGHAESCPECGSKSLTWDVTITTTSAVVQGRLRTSDVTGLFFLGCDECSETVSTVRMDDVAAFLNACRAAPQPVAVSDDLYKIANHIASAKGGLPDEWLDWAEEIETDIRRAAMLAAPGKEG